MLKGKTVVGHALHNDFQALGVLPNDDGLEKVRIRDTQQLKSLRIPGETGIPSLKNLANYWLKEDIQAGAHSSVEDARAAMRLYKLKEKQWEAGAEDGALRKRR